MGCVQGRAVHGLVFALFVEGWGWEEKKEGRRRAERRDARRMEGKERRGGREGRCLSVLGWQPAGVSALGDSHFGPFPHNNISSLDGGVPHAGLKGNLQVDLL